MKLKSKKINFLIKFIFTILLGVLAGYLFHIGLHTPHSNTSQINNDGDKNKVIHKVSKNKVYAFNKSPIIHSTQKLSSPIQIQFKTKENKAILPNEAFTLIINISSQMNIENAKIQWQIPDGVRHLHGQLPKQVYLNQKSPLEIEADFVVSEDKNYQIHTLVSSGDQYTHFAQSAQFNTYIYRELKDKLSQMKLTNKNYVNEMKKIKILQ